MLIFTFFMFQNFSHMDPLVDECYTLFSCSITMLTQGFRMGGGIGDYINDGNPPSIVDEPTWFIGRSIFDLTYFLVFTIVLLNIIFGIIIDTFGEKRSRKEEKDDNRENMCFICGLERPTFEKLGQGRFEEHIQHDHPATHYMFFILLLKDIPVGEQSSLQAHIHRCILKQDTSWMPHGHATCLEEQHGVPEKQDVLMQVGQMLEASAKQLTHRIEQVEEKLVEKLGRAQEATELQLDHKQLVEQLTSHMESSSQAMALLQQSHSSLQEQLAKLQS